jgi:outer membrane lipoprotein-sorting protein
MISKYVIAIVFSAPLLASASLLPETPYLNGEAIEIKQDQMQTGYIGETRTMTLTLGNAQGEESIRKVNFEGFEGDRRHDKTVLRFVYPADIKGTALLTHEQGSEDDDQWLYLPAIKRVKRIASSNQSGSFMGSEFAYEDLVVRQIDKYTYRYLGDEEIDGKDCYVIERKPKNKNSGYSKVIRWRMKSNLQELKTEYYDRKGELLKQRKMEGHRLIDGFWRVKKITVKNVQTNKYSTLTFDDVKIKLDLPEHKFSVREFNSVE